MIQKFDNKFGKKMQKNSKGKFNSDATVRAFATNVTDQKNVFHHCQQRSDEDVCDCVSGNQCVQYNRLAKYQLSDEKPLDEVKTE